MDFYAADEQQPHHHHGACNESESRFRDMACHCARELPPLRYIEEGCRYLLADGRILVEVQRCARHGELQFVLLSSRVKGLWCDGVKPFYVSVTALVNEVQPPRMSAGAEHLWLFLLAWKRTSYKQPAAVKKRP